MRWLARSRTSSMHNLICKFVDRLPLQFRVLYRQFLLRIVDLEALSIEADIPRFLGQFAGVLMMFSMINALGLLIHPPIDNIAYLVGMFWTVEQRMIFTMMLVVGLFAVISWDSIFPDRRDVMVLGPLPLTPHTILIAKMAASGAVMGLAVLALNFAVELRAVPASRWVFALSHDPRGLSFHNDRGQPLSVWLSPHRAGTDGAPAPAPRLPARLRPAPDCRLRAVHQRLFS